MLFIAIVLSLFFNCQRKKAFLQCVSEPFRIASQKTLHEPRRTEHSLVQKFRLLKPRKEMSGKLARGGGGGGGEWEWGFSPHAIIFFRSMTSRSTLRSALSERLKEVKQDISCKVRRARWGEGNVPFASLGSKSACHVGYNYSEWLSRKWPHMPACVTSPCTGTVSTNIGGRHKPRNKKFERATVLVIHSLILLSSGASLIRHFRVPPGLCIKTRLSAQPLMWKWFFILMQINLIFTRKAVLLASFWKWRFLELVRGLLHGLLKITRSLT